jgi:hypothetical protein
MTDHTLFGFDGSCDDVAVVVMSRHPGGTWRIESTTGPDVAELARLAAELCPPPAPPLPAPASPLADRAAEWMATLTEEEFVLTDWQRDLLRRLYGGNAAGFPHAPRRRA